MLAPYVTKSIEKCIIKYRKRGMSYNLAKEYALQDVEDELLQGCEAIDTRLNTINNALGQPPFVAFSFGLDTTPEGRMVVKAILNARIKGIGAHNLTPVFPKLSFLHRNEINGLVGSPNYDLKLLGVKCSMTRMYPDWLSLDAGSLGDIYDKHSLAVSQMGCRAFLSEYTAEGDDKPHFVGRANYGAVSLNLPMYALETNGNVEDFYKMIDKYFDIAIDVHLMRKEKIGKRLGKSNPLFWTQGGCSTHIEPNEPVAKALDSFTCSIGYIGLDETVRVLSGKSLLENQELGKEILEYIDKKIKNEKNSRKGFLVAFYSTPSESLCHRFNNLNRAKFGEIENVTTREYLTNSFHVPVYEKVDAIKKQLVESQYFHITTGGRIVYNEFPRTQNFDAVLECINHAMSLGLYYGINLQLDTCNECGYQNEFKGKLCPECGSNDVTQINRVCGYLSYQSTNGKDRINKGKLQEVVQRVDHFDC